MKLNPYEPVFFVHDYNGTKKGDKGIYVCHIIDSGYRVPLIIIENDEYRESMKRYEFNHPKQLANRRGVENLWMDCHVVKPDEKDIASIRLINEELEKMENRKTVLMGMLSLVKA